MSLPKGLWLVTNQLARAPGPGAYTSWESCNAATTGISVGGGVASSHRPPTADMAPASSRHHRCHWSGWRATVTMGTMPPTPRLPPPAYPVPAALSEEQLAQAYSFETLFAACALHASCNQDMSNIAHRFEDWMAGTGGNTGGSTCGTKCTEATMQVMAGWHRAVLNSSVHHS
ncbi:hypothetical protein B0H10DRAFT_2227872 [Mycena sp. CBHHK59/15]|nr:hypothetical protein B0H10DRAFT_2227872 [Mycena sp. CBHHK59/15]